MRTWVIGMALLLAASMCAYAADPDETANKLRRYVTSGDAKSAAVLLADEEATASLVGKPSVLRRVSDAIANHSKTLAVKDAENTATFMDQLVATADACRTAHEQDPDTIWATASAHLARGRALRVITPDTNADDWVAAATAFTNAASATSDDGRCYLAALRILTEAPFDARASHVAVTKGLEKLTKKALASYGDSTEIALALARTNFDFARTSLERKKADAKAFMRGVFACVNPFMKGAQPSDDAATLHHDAVTFCIESKIVLKQRYRMVESDALGGSIEFSYPLASYWSEAPPTDRLSRRVIQKSVAGDWDRRVRFRSYSFAIDYIFSDGTEVGGDNIKNLCKLAMEQMDRIFSKVESRSKPKKGKLNKKNVGYVSEMRGLDTYGKPLLARLFMFRGKQQKSYLVTIFDYSMAKDMGPAMQAFIDTVHEREK